MSSIRIVMLQSVGLNPANKEYKKTCYKAFNDMDDVEAALWGPGYHGYAEPWESISKWANVIIHMEDYNNLWVRMYIQLQKIAAQVVALILNLIHNFDHLRVKKIHRHNLSVY